MSSSNPIVKSHVGPMLFRVTILKDMNYNVIVEL